MCHIYILSIYTHTRTQAHTLVQTSQFTLLLCVRAPECEKPPPPPTGERAHTHTGARTLIFLAAVQPFIHQSLTTNLCTPSHSISISVTHTHTHQAAACALTHSPAPQLTNWGESRTQSLIFPPKILLSWKQSEPSTGSLLVVYHLRSHDVSTGQDSRLHPLREKHTAVSRRGRAATLNRFSIIICIFFFTFSHFSVGVILWGQNHVEMPKCVVDILIVSPFTWRGVVGRLNCPVLLSLNASFTVCKKQRQHYFLQKLTSRLNQGASSIRRLEDVVSQWCVPSLL